MGTEFPQFVDWFTQIDNELQTTNSDLDEIRKGIELLLKSNGVNSPSITENALLLWPAPPEPPSSITEINPQNLVATIPQGRTIIDYTNGTVKIPGQPEESLNNKLSGLNSDYVRSIFVNADNHVYWYAPSENAGGYIDQFRGFDVPVTRVKELWLFAFEPTTITVFAGTQAGSTTHTTSPQRSMERVTSDGTTDGVEITIDKSGSNWVDLKWTNEEDVLSKNPQPMAPLHTMNLAQIGFVLANTGDYDINVAMDAKETIYEHHPADNIVGFGPVDNWTESSPKTIPAGEKRVYSFSDWGHHFLKFKAQSASAGNTTSIAGSFLGKTG